MKMIGIKIWILACSVLFSSCEKEELSFNGGDIEIEIRTGEHWLHNFSLFLGLSRKNEPQFAVWIEDTSGNYLSTVFVTYKIATEGWSMNKGNRRKEALPHWCHQRGVIYKDGLMLPTKDNPLTDGITGATPKENKIVQVSSVNLEKPFVIKAEFNHSTDFNDGFPEDAKEGAANYSGGKMGSGQPALVYARTIYSDTRITELELIGYSSPDGSDGNLHSDFAELSTAKTIVEQITVSIK